MCFLKYDFIGKLEHIHEDFDYMNHLLLQDKVSFGKPRTKVQSTTDMVKGYFSRIPYEMFVKLLKVYEMDFRLFDYDTMQKALYPDSI